MREVTVQTEQIDDITLSPTDVDDLLVSLDAALTEGQQPTRFESGIRRARQYSWDECCKGTLQLYQSLTGIL